MATERAPAGLAPDEKTPKLRVMGIRVRRVRAAALATFFAATAGAGCRGDFDSTDSESGSESTSADGTGSSSSSDGEDTSSDSTSESDSDSTEDTAETGPSDLVEECDGCWSGWCEIGGNRCALGVFVTNVQFVGSDLGGVGGADMQCALQAGGPGQPFHAWVSTDAEAAPDHVNLLDDRLYVLKDGTLVAQAKQDFVTGGLFHAIDLDAQGAPAPPMTDDMACAGQGAWTVWTGTTATGESSGSDCSEWNGDGNGVVGRSDRTVGGWTDQCSSMCHNKAGLYCFQDPL